MWHFQRNNSRIINGSLQYFWNFLLRRKPDSSRLQDWQLIVIAVNLMFHEINPAYFNFCLTKIYLLQDFTCHRWHLLTGQMHLNRSRKIFLFIYCRMQEAVHPKKLMQSGRFPIWLLLSPQHLVLPHVCQSQPQSAQTEALRWPAFRENLKLQRRSCWF